MRRNSSLQQNKHLYSALDMAASLGRHFAMCLPDNRICCVCWSVTGALKLGVLDDKSGGRNTDRRRCRCRFRRARQQ